MRVQGVVVISGANRGIGLEITRALLRHPDVTRVFAGCRDMENIDCSRFLVGTGSKKPADLQSSYDPEKKLRVLELDVTKDWSIKNVRETIEKSYDHVNLLINNAGVLDKSGTSGIPNGDRTMWLHHFDVNLVSHAMMIQEFLPLLKSSVAKGGPATVVNISGLKGSIANGVSSEKISWNIAYGCSKAALNKLSKTVSHQNPEIIAVSICPGWNKTSMGGEEGMMEPTESAPLVVESINNLTKEHTGGFWNRKLKAIPF